MTQPRKQRKPRKKPTQISETTILLQKIKELEKKVATAQKQPRPISYKLPPPPKDTARLQQLEAEIKALEKRLPMGISTTDPRYTVNFDTLRQFADRQTQSSTVEYLSRLQATQQEKEQKAIDKLLEDTYKTDIEARDKRKTEILQAKAKGNQEEFYDLISMVSREHKERSKVPIASPIMSPFISSSASMESFTETPAVILKASEVKTKTERPTSLKQRTISSIFGLSQTEPPEEKKKRILQELEEI